MSGFGGKISEGAVNPWLPYLLPIRLHLGERQETLVRNNGYDVVGTILPNGFADVKSSDCPGCGHGKTKQNIEYGGDHDDHPSKEDSPAPPPALHPNAECDCNEKDLKDDK